MLPILALILMINGVQVDLPTPAYLVGDNAFVPARAVFEKLGYQVVWNHGGSLFIATPSGPLYGGLDGPQYSLELGQARLGLPHFMSMPEDLPLPAAPQMRGDVLYVPIRAVALIASMQASVDRQKANVSLTAMPAEEPMATDLATIVAAPARWVGKRVVVTGEPTSGADHLLGPAAVSVRPPDATGDWILRDADAEIFCAPEAGSPLPPPAVGRRVQVEGLVARGTLGFPYLRVSAVEPLPGSEGLTCYVTTDRPLYRAGETVTMEIHIVNPTAESITVSKFIFAQFTVQDPAGQVVWQTRLRPSAMPSGTSTLVPGEQGAGTEQWPIPAGARPGLYRVSARLGQVCAYPQTIGVEEVTRKPQ